MASLDQTSILNIISILRIPLLLLTNILALALRPYLSRTSLIFSTLPISLFLTFIPVFNSNSVPSNYGSEYTTNFMALATFFKYVDSIVLANPDRERWYKLPKSNEKNDEKRTEDDKGTVALHGFCERFRWAAELATSNRYPGWSQEVKNTPFEVEYGYPRWKFFIRKSLRAAYFIVLSVILHSYTEKAEQTTPEPTKVSFFAQLLAAWLSITFTYLSVEISNIFYNLLFIIFHLAAPRECPSHFGDLRKAYTLRNCRGRVWHQNLRRTCTFPSQHLTHSILRIQPGTFASRYLQLFSGFFVSACIHGGASMLTRRALHDGGWFAVLMLQAVAIMVEDYVILVGRKLGVRESVWWKWLGGVWVVLWVGWSLAGQVGEMEAVSGGFGRVFAS